MLICRACGEENPERFRLCGFCGTPLAPPQAAPEVRKTVTIVFSDLTGSTALGESLDSESLRALMTRYFDEMRRVLELHGGTVEKFIGDAVMAVFGLPKVHEDDALRAVRAARDMQHALERLNDDLETGWGVRLANRTGVNTGEVVAGDPAAGQRLVTGDAVNVAARLEQAAAPLDVLIGDLTYRLVRDAVDVEPVAPLELKGKAERVPAFRLVSVRGGEGFQRRDDAPIVGRDTELAALTEAFRSAVADRRCRLCSVLGQAGVGKSRLTREFLALVGTEGARTLRGRCLPYGQGITFWPLVEAVREAAGIREEDDPELARAKVHALAGEGEEDVAERVASAIGLAPTRFPVQELFWGTRKLLEHLAAEGPLVVVFDDVHWAESTFLDLVDHLVETVQDAPLLLLCPARPDLIERRPEWAAADHAVTIALEPLDEEASALIVENLLGDHTIPGGIRDRIVEAADGNPLFVEQMLSMLIDEGVLQREESGWTAGAEAASLAVPPTIQALLAARLEFLSPEERAVIEAASVVGLVFPEPAVEALVTDELRPRVGGCLAELVRKQFARQAEASRTDEKSFRFHHILIRDAAYGGLLKRARATLHERFVAWADSVNADRAVEYEEILAYHLEQAHRYLSELGPPDAHGTALARRAAERLASAGHRAFDRGDMPAAANLLQRAAVLLPTSSDERLQLLPDIGEALAETGQFAEAIEVLEEAERLAAETGNETAGAAAKLAHLDVQSHASDPADWERTATEATAAAIRTFELTGNHGGLAQAWRLLAYVHGTACRYAEAADAARRAEEHARRAGDERQRSRAAVQYAIAAVYGPMPAGEAFVRCQRIVEEAIDDRRSEGLAMSLLARLCAMRGDFEHARSLYRSARATLEDLGRSVVAASTSLDSCGVEMLAGDPAAAERELSRDYAALSEMGETYLLSTVAAELARAVEAQGRLEEAARLTGEAEVLAADDDLTSQALWRSVRARVLAASGDHEHAIALAREAVSILQPTDAAVVQADALVDLAEVLRAGGEAREAESSLWAALELNERKGNVVAAGRVRQALGEPAQAPVTL